MMRKGFTRHGLSVAKAAAALSAAAAVAGLTAPVAVAQETPSGTWTMPAVREEVLQDAVDAVTEAAGADNVAFNVYDSVWNQVVYNYTNWVVCGQSPRADTEVKVGAKPQRVNLALKRRATGC